MTAGTGFATGLCPDCGADRGEQHRRGCDVARCAYTGFQCISCDGDHAGDHVPDRWTGEWPGVMECREFGLWCKAGPGGWVPCDADDPDATEDLNTLAEMGLTGQLAWNGQRWVRP